MTYQVSVQYGGKKLIPAPFINLRKVFQRSGDGTSRLRGWEIVVTGQIAAFSGSPDYTGTFWSASGYPPLPNDTQNIADNRLANLKNKMRAITDLFSVDGQLFEIQPGDGSSTIKFNPRINKINYQDGKWFDVIPFTIEMEADCVYFGDYADGVDACNLTQAYNPPEETWNIEQSDEVGRTYKLTHTISSSAKKRYNEDGTVFAEGWQIALANIIGDESYAGTGAISYLGVSGKDFSNAPGVLDLDDYEFFNYTRGQQIDVGNGRVVVTETWLRFNNTDPTPPSGITSGKAIEELICDTKYSGEEGIFTVTLNGTITGLEQRNDAREILVTRYDNAIARFDPIYNSSTLLHDLGETLSGKDLNPVILSSTVARNKITGVIQYSVVFDTRPALSNSDYLSEIYTVTIDHAADVFASLGVVARPSGPILQDIGSTTQKSISLTAEIVVAVGYGLAEPTSPSYNSLAAAISVIGIPTQMLLASDREVWAPRRGRYSRNTTYVYQ